MPEPPDDLLHRLRAEADRLDAAAPPIAASEARSGPAAKPDGRRWVPVAAAVVVLAAIGAAWLVATGDDDPEQLIVPADPPSTTTTTTLLVDSLFDVPMGIAVIPTDGPVRVLDLDGAELGTVPAPVEAINGPEVMLTDPPSPVVPIDPAEVPPGCSSAFGGGAVRVALCGGEPQQPTQIDSIDATGSRRTLHLAPLDPEAPTGVRAGHWRWALPSPDGQWALAQWSGECEVPEAFLLSLTFDDRPIDLGPVPPWTRSRALGWTEDGRAIIDLSDGACGTGADVPGVYLLDPASHELSLVVELDQGETAYVWRTPDAMSPIGRLLTRAQQELDLQYVLGPDDVPVVSFEGHLIDINGNAEPGPPDPAAQPMGVLHGQASLSRPGLVEGAAASLSFTCGEVEWRLDWLDEGQPEVDSMLLLAEALVPHLYCTLPAADPSG